MLICYQCQFENEPNNKFCQRCGTSLTHNTCHSCGASVAVTDEHCHKCGALTATIWWAIVYKSTNNEENIDPVKAKNLTQTSPSQEKPTVKVDFSQKQNPRSKLKHRLGLSLNNLKEEPEPEKPPQEYIDEKQRYRWLKPILLENREPENSNSMVYQGKVIDCNPLEKFRLDEILDQLEEQSQDTEFTKGFWERTNLPQNAKSYLTLEEFSPTIPPLQDAWRENNQEIILLPDRSEWQFLSELIMSQGSNLTQIISYFDEIASLWNRLAKQNCAQSLLVENNLRVDENQSFCLQRLYFDGDKKEQSLGKLGELYKKLLAYSELNYDPAINEILTLLITEQIESIQEFRNQLKKLNSQQSLNKTSEPEVFEIDETVALNNLATQIESINWVGEVDEQDFHDLSDGDETIALNNFPFQIETESTAGSQDDVTIQFTSTQKNTADEETAVYSNTSAGDDLPTIVLPMQLQSLTDAAVTDVGTQREHNEDYYFLQSTIKKEENSRLKKVHGEGIYIVCDGMGGHASGEVASKQAVESLQKYINHHWQDQLPNKEVIQTGILQTNQQIYDMNMENGRSGSQRMGTTLVMALVKDHKVAIAHVGDSRIYAVTRKGVKQLTVDHSVGQQRIQQGIAPEIAYQRPDAYQLTQALGPRDSNFVKPDISFMEFKEDTLLLLCSDGLSDNDLVEIHGEEKLVPFVSSRTNLQEGAQQLIELANEHNGHDNITAILVRIKVQPALDPRLF